ncbi:MAG TPA: hypothetical protein VH186_19925 [Chloroflexia bacterium]|nr:hypothetical protein [Chloroflexia bacterium]
MAIKSNVEKQKMSGRCPNCGSTNIQSEPLYPYDEEEDPYVYDDNEEPGEIAVFCVSCGHYMGEMNSQLGEKMRSFRNQLNSWLD